MLKYSIGPALCLALGLSASGPLAHAQSVDTITQSQTVHYADLDLNRPTDAKALMRRIHSAAARVCGDAQTLGEYEQYWDCVRMAEDKAVSDVNKPTVTAAYTSKDKHIRLAQAHGGQG
jgi:UrcA family protein